MSVREEKVWFTTSGDAGLEWDVHPKKKRPIGERKFGTREEGTTYSLHSFFRKLGQSVGPSLGLLLATWLGYDAALGASQTIEVATNMRYLVAFMYLLSALIQLVSYGLIYNIDRKTLENMERDLAQRREEVS